MSVVELNISAYALTSVKGVFPNELKRYVLPVHETFLPRQAVGKHYCLRQSQPNSLNLIAGVKTFHSICEAKTETETQIRNSWYCTQMIASRRTSCEVCAPKRPQCLTANCNVKEMTGSKPFVLLSRAARARNIAAELAVFR